MNNKHEAMCSDCSMSCLSGCNIAYSAIRGAEALYPLNSKSHQFGSKKKYPIDYSGFNINGRVFGANGAVMDNNLTNVQSAKTEIMINSYKVIKCKAPFILPAIAKLNWQDYYAGAAIYGVPAVIGESAIRSDPEAEYTNGKIRKSNKLEKMIDEYRKYQKEYGDIILQVNADDIEVETAEFALTNCELDSIEIKFGQAAKGIQHMLPVYSLSEAQRIKKQGYLVFPNPLDEEVVHKYNTKKDFYFTQYGRIPMMDEEAVNKIINKYKSLGAKNIYFKMAGYDINDIKRVLRIASENKVSLVTFDGAGGGTGNSPIKMMDEWGLPTLMLENIVCDVLKNISEEYLPQIAISGGFTTEDQIFKALAYGEKFINFIGIGRGAMTATMMGKHFEEMYNKKTVPSEFRVYGETLEKIFRDAEILNNRYNDKLSYGAIALYSYLDRLAIGLQLFMTLNRKFELSLLDRSDLIPLTKDISEIM